jgi:hypothetical protein
MQLAAVLQKRDDTSKAAQQAVMSAQHTEMAAQTAALELQQLRTATITPTAADNASDGGFSEVSVRSVYLQQ